MAHHIATGDIASMGPGQIPGHGERLPGSSEPVPGRLHAGRYTQHVGSYRAQRPCRNGRAPGVPAVQYRERRRADTGAAGLAPAGDPHHLPRRCAQPERLRFLPVLQQRCMDLAGCIAQGTGGWREATRRLLPVHARSVRRT